MRKFYLLLLTLAIFMVTTNPSMAYEREIREIALAMSESIVKAGKKSIAVVDFTDLQGNVTELGRFIAEEFSVSLAGAGKGFELVDRIHLKSIAQEHKLSAMGIIDPKTARKLGKITGVEALLTGVITPFKDSIRLSIKLLETESAKIIYGSAANIPRTKAIEELMGRGIETRPATLGASTPAAPSLVKPLQKVEVQGFLFEVNSCKLSAQSLTCFVTVTNKAENDRNLRIYSVDSRIIDDSGNEYRPDNMQFGSKRSSHEVTNTMVSGVPTKVTLLFDGISSSPNRIALLEVRCKGFTAQLRNIPLVK